LKQLNGAMAKIAQGLFNSRIVIEQDDEIVSRCEIAGYAGQTCFDREEQKEHRKARLYSTQGGHGQARRRF